MITLPWKRKMRLRVSPHICAITRDSLRRMGSSTCDEMDPTNFQTAATYINNLLLARGLLRNGKAIDFAQLAAPPVHGTDKKSHAATNVTVTAEIINLVHDLILRRDVRENFFNQALPITDPVDKSATKNTKSPSPSRSAPSARTRPEPRPKMSGCARRIRICSARLRQPKRPRVPPRPPRTMPSPPPEPSARK